MSKQKYTEVICTTNMAEYKKKEQEFIELNDKNKSMSTTFIRKITFHGTSNRFPADFSIVMKDMEDVFVERKEKDDTIVTKELIPISKETANKILDGDYQVLLDSKEQTLHDFYRHIQEEHLVPTYRKEFTRKTFHQNQFNDIVFDVSMDRKPYMKNDFFAPKGFPKSSDYSSLRMSIRHNLGVSKEMEQFLAFEKMLSNQARKE